MCAASQRSIPEPGQAVPPAPSISATPAAQPGRSDDRTDAGPPVRRPDLDARRVRGASRAGGPTCSARCCPSGAPPHIGVLLDNTPDYLFAFGGAALAGAAVVGLNHTRRRAPAARHRRTPTGVFDHRTRPRRRHRGHRRRAAASVRIASSCRVASRVTRIPRRTLGQDLDTGARRRVGRRSGRPSPDPTTRWALIFTSGPPRRTEGGDLHAAPPHHHGHPAGDDPRLDADDVGYVVHAAVPLQRGDGRLGAVARDGARSALGRRFSASGWLPDVRRYGAT